ncbi:hypothetical protein J9B83_11510 [Marinomonas sp. A79]|uniref:YrhK domain-containing protein n=1 Tax=Marinomonas vulgaris TaxID=2823372 RepID=A0ABS5HF57_9GAMM|nr:hypothetical protein [Marinomonas vulgaris]MBR7889569.1 hypothetical protein [Marinomonas vulgaris]
MKETLRKLCSPILNLFETSEGDYDYKASHRTILVVLGLLCFVIASISFTVTMMTGELAGVIPIALFGITGMVCEIVGLLGNDRAVARIWKRH